MLYSVLQSNSTGYKAEDKILDDDEIGESYNKQNEYVVAEDFESAYVVKMQGLVEHLRYLMSFPPNEELDKNLPDGEEEEEEEEEEYQIIVDEGMIASAREIYEFLISKGFTPESACAIIGNIQQESAFNTGASNGTHFGLCQWGGARWENLRAFASQKGTSWTDLNTQLEFLWQELCGSFSHVKDAIIDSKDMEYATEVFCKEFEICGNYGIEVPKRYSYAKYWYNLFMNGSTNTELTLMQNDLLKVLQNLGSYSGIANDDGDCQKFVRTVLEKIGVYARGEANTASIAGSKWTVSNDINNIPVGAAVYGKGSTSAGHVGIYIGNGMVVHNIGKTNNCSYGGLKGIKCESISSWNQKYKFTGWGWQGGVDLSK